MTDNQTGWRQSTAGAPEPPVRAAYQSPQPSNEPTYPAQQTEAFASEYETQPVDVLGNAAATTPPSAETSPIFADTSGIDTAGHITQTSTFAPVGSPDTTESFQAARAGDTATMPSVNTAQAALASAASAGSTYYGKREDAPNASQGASAYQPTPGVPAPQPTAAARAAKPASAGKTFLFGFLGALLACALAFGGFTLLNGGKTNATSSALIGTTDQTVINAVDEGQTLAEAVAAKALPSVVAIYNYQNASNAYGYGYGYGMGNQGGDNMVATGMGSGVVISDDGYIITNYHVVEDAVKLTVSVDGVERDAEYVGGDSSSDIAVVKVADAKGLVTADLGDSDSLRIGEWVMTIGAPLGLEQSVATGVVSATNRSQIMDSSSNTNDLYSYLNGGNAMPEYTYYPNMIQTDAVINPGNSGGALVDADGKLIGINTMISSYSGDYAGVGFAIPVNYAIQIAQDVIEGKEPTHALLGVSLSQVNSQIAQRYNLSADQGAYISAITPDTGAANSDLAVGDIITKIDGKAVTSPTDVTLDIRAHKPGDKVTVTVNRDGETLDVEVTLTSDENIVKQQQQQQQQQQEQEQDSGPGNGGRDHGYGDGNGNGNGQGNGYNIEDLEELLKMLGM